MKDWKVLFYHRKGPGFLELLKQVLSSTQQGYDMIAQKFDHTPFRTSSDILDVVSTEMDEMPNFDSALDVCCGTGAMTKVLLSNTLSRVVGLDISQGMMKVARKNLGEHTANPILVFVQGEALHLPFKSEFDVVTNFGGLGHIEKKDVPAFLDQVYKVLKPYGKFIFVTTEHPSVFSSTLWRAYAFNFAMYIRNLLIKPPFIMYYLTFLLPRVKQQLERQGFEVEVREGLFPQPFHTFKMVIATKK
jgi:ubiquinone/menaquinone biosynthesis C-methylase UbiE